MKESLTLRQIEEMFDAVPETHIPDSDEIRFLDQRNRLERELSDVLEVFAVRYEIACV